MQYKRLVIIAITALAIALAAPANANSIFTFTSFEGPGNNGGGTTVNGINNNGDVTGFSSDNAGNPTHSPTSSVTRMEHSAL